MEYNYLSKIGKPKNLNQFCHFTTSESQRSNQFFLQTNGLMKTFSLVDLFIKLKFN